MEKTTTEQNKEEELVLHTVEELDKGEENKEIVNNENKPDEKDELIATLTKERDDYKTKYTKAIEVNNQLYQRLTSPKPVEESALQSILNKF